MPTATESRRAAARAISKGDSEGDKGAVASMMSHSVQTLQQYYAPTKGKEEAVKGYQLMESIPVPSALTAARRSPQREERELSPPERRRGNSATQ